jgi:hypothetical protein
MLNDSILKLSLFDFKFFIRYAFFGFFSLCI